MLDVNDDMDELFRRAAEDYPLKTDSHDWDKVAAGLPVNQPQAAAKSWFNRGKGLLLLLFVLPAAFICNHYTNSTGKADLNSTTYNKEQTPNTNAKQTVSANNVVTPQQGLAKKDVATIQQQAVQPIKAYSYKEMNNAEVINHTSRSSHNAFVTTDENIYKSSLPSSTPTFVETTNDKTKNIVEATTSSSVVNNNVNSTQPSQEKANEDISQKLTSTESKQEATPVKKEQIKQPKALHFYAGVIGNIDVSSVKFQSLRSPGTGAGILVGYQLRKRVSIESGVYTQKKFYYTDAKYYNPKTPYTAPTFKLLNVDGNCSMLEVPVNIKYDLKTTAKFKWFAVAGMSSYFMKKENYDYTSEMWGQVSTKNVSYTNSSNAFLSVINVSAGYQRQLGKSGMLRVEPYVKLPVKGFGWGRLPIMSSGLSVGYLKKIF